MSDSAAVNPDASGPSDKPTTSASITASGTSIAPSVPMATTSASVVEATTAATTAAPSPTVTPSAPASSTAVDQLSLTTIELQLLSEIDSKQYGFLKLNDECNSRKKSVVLKAIKYLERFIAQSRERMRRSQDDNNNGRNRAETCNVDPKIYCKLGHMHLLLEDYSKALSAYQKFYALSSLHWKDTCFLYGLGLVYFHFNAYVWSQRAFQELLYIDPAFIRAKEVHVRLALIAKSCHDYQMSLKHFRSAEDDTGACTFSPLEVRFHVAHLHEVKGDSLKAKEIYEELLKETSLSASLKADVYRQLGWMFHSVDAFGEKQVRIPLAIQHLQKSIEADSKSGQSLYLLGRCYAAIGKVHEAFIAYRNSVDKSESNNADTWCSIGVLYQQQNQPMDALQAYICAVQLDKDHQEAWTNLGILYESANQPQDAMSCFNNAGRKRPLPANLTNRIKYLKSQLSSIPPTALGGPGGSNKPKQLPSVEEAWNGQVSNEMTNRQPNKGGNKEGSPQKVMPGPGGHQPLQHGQLPQPRPPFYLNSQQLATLQYLQNQPTLLPQQQQHLLQLQQQFRMMQQHQQATRQQQQRQFDAMQQQQHQHQQQQQQEQQAAAQNVTDLLSELQNKDLGSVSDKELEDLLSQQDIGSFAESLLKQIQADEGDNIDLDDIKTEAGSGGEKEKSGDSKPDGPKINTLEIPTKIEKVNTSRARLKLDIGLKAIDVLERCQAYAAAHAGKIKLSASVLPDGTPPPQPPERPRVSLNKEQQLLPPTPSVYLENKKDTFSPELQDFCLQHPIAVVRGFANALKLDLGLFSTKTLQEDFATHPVEVWTQNKQSADENWDPVLMKQVWHCPTAVSHCSIGKYAQYQAASFQEGLRDDSDKPFSSAAFRDTVANELDPAKRKKKFPILKFAANVDLSDSFKWRGQLSELIKLPPWTRTVSAGNMLSHLGHQITGMNSVRLYMKVPCARIPAHQENNNFCLINLNIGPGDCEWFGVPNEYWGQLKQLCDKHKINYLSGSWWPNMHELMEEEIPVYRFLQRPGDLVWVNSGCVHWVQAAGWCNNITWNVGPLTHKQFSLALERYEWNKLQMHKSAVGMLTLAWNLARNIRLSEPELFKSIKNTLLQSLKQLILTVEIVKSKGLVISPHRRRQSDPAHFCAQCEREVFSILFLREEGKRPVIFCLDCALRKKPNLQGFVVMEEVRLKELLTVFDNFKLHPTPNLPSSSAAMASAASSSVSVSSALGGSHQTSPGSALTSDFMAAAIGHYPLLPRNMDTS